MTDYSDFAHAGNHVIASEPMTSTEKLIDAASKLLSQLRSDRNVGMYQGKYTLEAADNLRDVLVQVRKTNTKSETTTMDESIRTVLNGEKLPAMPEPLPEQAVSEEEKPF